MATTVFALWAAVAIHYDGGFFSKSWELLKLAAYGTSPFEHAAFVVRDADGTQRFVMWPEKHEHFEASYFGEVPAGAIAIIHTHPNELPYPSSGDAAVARRTGLPVFAVTRTMIARTDGQERILVATGDWSRSIK